MDKGIKIIFDEKCKAWHEDYIRNVFYLRQLEWYVSQRLQKIGFVLLSEIYEFIGLDKEENFKEHIFKYKENQKNYFDFELNNNLETIDFLNPNIELNIRVY